MNEFELLEALPYDLQGLVAECEIDGPKRFLEWYHNSPEMAKRWYKLRFIRNWAKGVPDPETFEILSQVIGCPTCGHLTYHPDRRACRDCAELMNKTKIMQRFSIRADLFKTSQIRVYRVDGKQGLLCSVDDAFQFALQSRGMGNWQVWAAWLQKKQVRDKTRKERLQKKRHAVGTELDNHLFVQDSNHIRDHNTRLMVDELNGHGPWAGPVHETLNFFQVQSQWNRCPVLQGWPITIQHFKFIILDLCTDKFAEEYCPYQEALRSMGRPVDVLYNMQDRLMVQNRAIEISVLGFIPRQWPWFYNITPETWKQRSTEMQPYRHQWSLFQCESFMLTGFLFPAGQLVA